jgi:hypothetical protein
MQLAGAIADGTAPLTDAADVRLRAACVVAGVRVCGARGNDGGIDVRLPVIDARIPPVVGEDERQGNRGPYRVPRLQTIVLPLA